LTLDNRLGAGKSGKVTHLSRMCESVLGSDSNVNTDYLLFVRATHYHHQLEIHDNRHHFSSQTSISANNTTICIVPFSMRRIKKDPIMAQTIGYQRRESGHLQGERQMTGTVSVRHGRKIQNSRKECLSPRAARDGISGICMAVSHRPPD